MDAQRETYDERMERERLEARQLRDETRLEVYGNAGGMTGLSFNPYETKHRELKGNTRS